MNKKNIFILVISSSITLAILLFLLLFFNIPRIHYNYDSTTDSYFVDKIYGNATTYSIPDTKNSKPITKICSRVFMDKTSIKNVELGKNITSIERLAFMNCKSLESINLEHVKAIGRNAFENCVSLKKVDLEIENVMGGTFIGCTNLLDITLKNTTSIGSYAFSSTGIETITIPSTCKNVSVYAFYQCDFLKKIIVLSSALSKNSYLLSLEGVEFLG